MSLQLRYIRLALTWVLCCFGSLLLILPTTAAVRGLKIITKQTQAKSHGINETKYVIRLAGKGTAEAHRSTCQVKIAISWSTQLGGPEIFTNSDASLMAIQFAPYWRRAGRVKYGRRIYLLVSTPNHGIKVIKDFSTRLNRLCLANKSRWNQMANHYYRPASTIFLRDVGSYKAIAGRTIYAQQYAINPKINLPEYDSIEAKVLLDGDLSFVQFDSQGY